MSVSKDFSLASKTDSVAAPIAHVKPYTPADDAGFVPGCYISSVDGHPIRDMIDWAWYSDEDSIEVAYIDTEGERGSIILEREPYEEWGFVFDGTIFDRIKTCRNSCTFCFMRQMPDGVRDSLVLRDDDFRMSFFEGTFVTLTNVDPPDEERIIKQHISPLRMSLHAISSDVRKSLIGKNEGHGIEVCQRLLDAGIQMHMQIVLVPGVNDGEELSKTLSWAYEREGVVGIGVVPLGFTKHQGNFDKSFNTKDDARAVIELIKGFQKRALAQRGVPWVYASDEFYRNAYPDTLLDELPPAEYYGEFDMFEDGIGIIRSSVDAWRDNEASIQALAELLNAKSRRVHYVIGYAQREFLIPLIQQSPLNGLLLPFPVRNDYFGGNVDVTGLLCACDIIRAINEAQSKGEHIDLAVIPDIVFNADLITLDDMSLEDIQNALAVPLAVVSCNPALYFDEIAAYVSRDAF